MYYTKLNNEDDKELSFYCKKCGHIDNDITMKSIVISKTIIKEKDRNFSQIINKYTKLDPTLPRNKNIQCPNTNCSSKEKDDHEIIYIRYDNENMKYINLCPTCDTIWEAKNK